VVNSFCDTKPKMPSMAGPRAKELFLLVGNYILQGRHANARQYRLLSRCNDVGLVAEEFDPLTNRMLGNFPQAYSHVGLINCALDLSQQTGPVEERA
jgi:GH15 family glucan-1,4-alpha-glucosidase